MPVTCDFCGRVEEGVGEDGEGLPLTWTTSVEHGRTRTFCAACTREHLRAMEARLDSESW